MFRKLIKKINILLCVGAAGALLNACFVTDAIAPPPGGVSAEEVQMRVNQAAADGWLFGCYYYLLDLNPSALVEDCLKESNDTLTTFVLVRGSAGNNLGLDRQYYRGETVKNCEEQASGAAFISTFTYFQSVEKTTTVSGQSVRFISKDDIPPSGLFASANAAAGCNEVLQPTGHVVELGVTGL